MSTTHYDVPPGVASTGRRAGYAIAVVINLAVLIVVLNILEWDILPWLTDDFAQLVPWIGFSLVATIAANLVYEFHDTPATKSTGQIVLNLIAIVVSAQILSVFPFDFSAYGFDWALVTRIILILAMIGAGVGVIAETVKLASRGATREGR